MNQIMQLFYRPARERGEPVPHILGLSASPVTSVKQGGLESAICSRVLWMVLTTCTQDY